MSGPHCCLCIQHNCHMPKLYILQKRKLRIRNIKDFSQISKSSKWYNCELNIIHIRTIDKNSMNLGCRCGSLIINLLACWKTEGGLRGVKCSSQAPCLSLPAACWSRCRISTNLQHHLCLHPTMMIMNHNSDTINKLQLNAF